jgi:hypothetical protein
MPRETPRTPLWTLYKEQQTATAELHERDDGSLELWYLRDGQIVAWTQSKDGAALIGDAAIERFDLEVHGWRPVH